MRSIHPKILVLLILFFVISGGCLNKRMMERLSGNSNTQGAPKVLTSTDGQSQIAIPNNWKEDRTLHDAAELQASDRANEMYIIVLTDNKQDFDAMSAEEHSKITQQNLIKGLTSPQATPLTRLTINGNSAVQTEIRGTLDKVNLVYLHTTVETPKNFYQIIAWTLPSRFDKNQNILKEIIQSFKEV